MASACHCERGFVCEEHPDQPDGHPGATAACAGIQCQNPDCPWWQGSAPAALDGAVFFEDRIAPALPERARRMLKADAPLRWRRRAK